jgi:pyruvate/2-oxoglutarate dehydrogenase complex dihydrolipoamide dehydrogenase (E3) component
MAELIKPDLCVIGAGPAGLDVAAGAAALGVPVVLVERGAMGGRWLNGSVGATALIAAARAARRTREAQAFTQALGATAPDVTIDYAKVREHVRAVVAAVAPNATRERYTAFGVRVIAGAARFTDRKTVAIGDAVTIRARRFVIATGSSPSPPPIAGLDSVPHVTEDTILDLTEIPAHLIVVGASPTALALAQAFRWFGTAVTVVDAAEPLAGEDPECAGILLDQLGRDGIVLRAGVAVARVEQAGQGIQVVLAGTGTEETIAGSHLMVAAGRRPNVDGLGLAEARVRCEAERIVLDHGLRTTNKRIYAIGDVAGAPPSVHAARHHAGLVVRNALFRQAVRLDPALVPRVTFTEPALAHVGLDEVAARQGGRPINVLRWPYRENDLAQAERDVCGHIKVVTDPKGRILGATIVGREAAELIVPWTLAVSQRLDIRAFAGMVVPYPTLAEVGKRAATTYFSPSLTSSWVRRIITMLRRLG